MIFKIFWILRGLLYKPFFGKFELPSYIGKAIFIGNFKRIFINKRVRIFPGARIEVIGNEASIIFEENISIGQNLHITSASQLIIGKNTTILGKQCIVGANAVVRGHFPSYCVIVGVPARIVKRYDEKSGAWKKTDKNGEFVE